MRHRSDRRGFSITELMVVLTLMGILLSLSVPTFQRTLEQSKSDIAVANLRALWAAQRLYWLDNRLYAPDIETLQSLDLLDPAVTNSTTANPYVYAIASGDASTFTATATRAGSGSWQGGFTIDQTGLVTGSVQSGGEAAIVPAPQ